MDADWYEDPLGRYDGRFFDGETWTAQVSDSGALETDPDFPPAELEPEPVFAPGEQAVEPLEHRAPRQATMGAESPTRTVAVLDESVMPGNATQTAVNPALTWLLLAGLLVAALVGFFLLRDDSTLDATEEDRVEDLEASGLTSDATSDDAQDLAVDAATAEGVSGANYDESEAVMVGTLRIVNGARVLGELETWHQSFAADRGIDLEPAAGCWFGEIGDAAVQIAQCGPVGGGGDRDYLFDLVPLDFADVEDGGFLAIAVVEDVTPNAVLANTLRLVGHSGSDSPPLALDERGGRAGQDDQGDDAN